MQIIEIVKLSFNLNNLHKSLTLQAAKKYIFLIYSNPGHSKKIPQPNMQYVYIYHSQTYFTCLVSPIS